MYKYNSLDDLPRTMDQLTDKLNKIQRNVKFFNIIYKKLEDMWESGNRDSDIILNADKLFKQQHKGTLITMSHGVY